MLHTCKVQLSFRQDEHERDGALIQGYGVNLGPNQKVDADAEIPGAPDGVTLRSLVDAGHLSGDHFDPPIVVADSDETEERN